MSQFWHKRRVLLTGHTGFKGAWAARWLARRGARVTGLALPPEDGPQLARLLGTAHLAGEYLIDLAARDAVTDAVAETDPEIVLHMAAQPIVRRSYDDPIETFATNVMGTAHLLEALRHTKALDTVLIVTSDKVYENDESGRAFAEIDRLGGHDPYSASKAATEIVASSFARSFFAERNIPVATARGGNVIGGGDFAEDRLIPDIVRAAAEQSPLTLRHPEATRPWQHVLDCLAGYLSYTEALSRREETVPLTLNFGPLKGERSVPVGEIAGRLQDALGQTRDTALEAASRHEMTQLSIDPSEAVRLLGWRPKLDIDRNLDWTAAWYAAFLAGDDAIALTDQQIGDYEKLNG